MDLQTYQAFTDSLVANLSRDERVLGLLAVGSMAATDRQPDQWSDHDFLVVTQTGLEDEFRNSTDWLPYYRPIVLNFRETIHGRKILYDDGHLLEYAIFNSDDFHIVRINSYRILIDRGGFTELVKAVVAETQASTGQVSDEFLFGQFLTHILIGCGRFARGEKINAAQLVKYYALEDLLGLLARFVPIGKGELLDNIAPSRRFELVFPDLGGEINEALSGITPQAALAMLQIAQRELGSRMNNYNRAAVSTVQNFIRSNIT